MLFFFFNIIFQGQEIPEVHTYGDESFVTSYNGSILLHNKGYQV